MVAEKRMSRRSLVDWLLGIGVVGSSMSFLYPVLKFVIPPAIAEAIELSVVAGQVGELPPNSGKVFKFGRRPALLINTPSGELHAFDGICTHVELHGPVPRKISVKFGVPATTDVTIRYDTIRYDREEPIRPTTTTIADVECVPFPSNADESAILLGTKGSGMFLAGHGTTFQPPQISHMVP
jgi:hypothetical protein